MDIDKKADILWANKAVYVDERIDYGRRKICIYAVFDFFVEVDYDVKSSSITKIRALESDQDWKGYLDSVNLNNLF